MPPGYPDEVRQDRVRSGRSRILDEVQVMSASPRRQRLSAAERRATILEAAIPLFASAGYEQTRVSDIAAQLGVTEPVIFQNFGTKSALFAAALEDASRQAAGYLRDLAAQHTNVYEWLSNLLGSEHLDYLHAASMFGVMFAEAHRFQLEADIAAALRTGMAHTAGAIADILRRGQAEGSIRADIAPLTLAWLVVSHIHSRQFRRSYTPDPSAVLEHELLERVLETFRPRDVQS